MKRRFGLLLAGLILLFINQTNSQGSPWITQSYGLTTAPWHDVRLAAVSNTVCWGLHFRTGSQYTRTTDGGAQWTAGTISGAPVSWRGSGITALDTNTAWVLMHDPSSPTSGGVFKTTDGGASWTHQTTAFPGTGGFPKIVHFFDVNVGLCVGDPDGSGDWEIYRTTNGGSNWSRVPQSSVPRPLTGEITFFLGARSGNSFWFSGGDGNFTFWRLYRTTDRGLTWTVRDPTGSGTRFPAFASATHGIAAGWVPESRLRRTTDGGDAWSSETITLSPYFTPGFFGYVRGTVGTYVMTNGFRPGFSSTPGCAYTTNGGDSWTVIDTVVSRGIASFASPTTGWSSGDFGVVYKWNSNLLVPPSPWIAQLSGLPTGTPTIPVRLAAVSDSVCWGVNTNADNQFILTTDGGAQWLPSSIPTAPSTWRGSYVAAVDANTAWILMRDPSFARGGGVFKTTDGGSSWTPQLTAFEPAGGNPRIIHFFDANVGVCVGYPNPAGDWEIYRTTNGGTLWTRIHLSAQPGEITFFLHSAFGNSLWFSSGNSGIEDWRLYRTSDRGLTWSTFHHGGSVSFPAFRDSVNGLTARSVPANQVRRTTDGGTTWNDIPVALPFSTRFIRHVPGTSSSYVMTSYAILGLGGVPGSAYTTNDGVTWTLIDNVVHRGPAAFFSSRAGWCGGQFDSLYKWTGDSLVTGVSERKGDLPERFALEQNYPNPFNPSTKIGFKVHASGFTSLKVYDVLGREVRTLVNENLHAGSYEVTFDATGLASGVYFYRLHAGEFAQTKRLVLLR
jgi:photosystem II stability/assembly factor-like uncharacterized protein